MDTPSGRVAYVDVGHGPVALFVHGAGTSSHLWRHVIGALAGEARCIAIDMPLHGRTPARPDQDFSLRGLANVLEDFCACLDLADIHLVANDTGGAVAQVFAVRQPHRPRSLTLTDCDTHDNLPPPAFQSTVELAARGALADLGARSLRDLDLARSGTLGGGYERPDLLTEETIRAYLEPVFGTPQAGRQFERLLTSLRAADLVEIEPLLRKLTVPTLIVWGTADVFFDLRWAYWLRDTIPGATKVVEIEGAKLFLPDERAGELVAALRPHWTAS